jgi:hypothetical protein
MNKPQKPSTKSQKNPNIQNPNFQNKKFRMFQSFAIGVWDLPGIWNLGLGILPTL